jgi:hypothetical protein
VNELDATLEARFAALEAQLKELEEEPAADGTSETNYIVLPGGETVNITEVNEEIVTETINEFVAEEGDLIVGGKGKKAKTLKRGTAGQVLTVDPGTLELVWATPEGGGGGGPRTVSGRVDPEGEIESGEGFTVLHSTTGRYRIDFDEEFDDPPELFVVAQALELIPESFPFVFVANYSFPQQDRFRVEIYQLSNGELANAPFSFLAREAV